MSLDLAVAQALHGARVLETAVHERTGWSVVIGKFELPVTRTVGQDGVLFRTSLPDLRLADDMTLIELRHLGQTKLVQPFHPQGDGPWDVEFELRLVDPVSV